MPDSSSSTPSTSSARQCSKITRWGQCQQPAWAQRAIDRAFADQHGLCRSHEEWRLRNVVPDPYYERKIVEGLTTPTFSYVSDAEAHALLNGRYRGDGRRVDQYIVGDPLGIELEPKTDAGYINLYWTFIGAREQLRSLAYRLRRWWWRIRP